MAPSAFQRSSHSVPLGPPEVLTPCPLSVQGQRSSPPVPLSLRERGDDAPLPSAACRRLPGAGA